jgi:tetratricopeptide (TPR) repeat protein
MSSNTGEVEEACANCGKAEVDDVKLKICTACKLVKYCSVECQKNHRPQHKKTCKKRAAEIQDDRLFRQPEESHLGECPICCLPLSLDNDKRTMMACCSKLICDGCDYANNVRESEEGLEHKCPYCREPVPDAQEECEKNLMERVKVNDPVALNQMGSKCYNKGDYEGAFEYWTKSAELGDINAHYNLACSYSDGVGVEKDMKKSIYYLEEAAIGGHPEARYNLGANEWNNRRFDRAVKHNIIAAKLGDDEALEMVKKGFATGYVSKEDFEAALRGHQAAVDATKSTQREKVEKARQEGRWD